jgi:predicted nucleic acid-binding protein
VLREQGSDLALQLWESGHRAASSVLVYPEGCAALAAAHRGNRVTSRLYRESRHGLDQVHDALITIGVDQQLTRSAGEFAADFGLRGYDAVHLATALNLSEDGVALVTWDHALSRAALEAGLPVLGE